MDKIFGIPSRVAIGLHGSDEDNTTVAMIGFLRSLKLQELHQETLGC